MSLRNQFLGRLRDRLADDPPSLRIRFWDGGVFDFSPAPSVTITLLTKRLIRFFLTGNMGRLARAYVDGEIEVDGSLRDTLQIGIRLAERLGRSASLRRLAQLLPRRRHSKAGDAAAIRYHYDVSNAFYALWLDRNMVYSCGYFENGDEDLDTAQEQKLDHLCRKLRLQPGDRLLDIGCGWGGLLCWAAAR